MKSTLLTRGVLITAVSTLAITLSACGSDDPADSSASADTQQRESRAPREQRGAASSDEPFGAGCSAVPAEGEGSFTGMTDDPVATAASNNPALSTLVQAVTAANLGDTLNSHRRHHRAGPGQPGVRGGPGRRAQRAAGRHRRS